LNIGVVTLQQVEKIFWQIIHVPGSMAHDGG
jgi:hypothetical protein